MAERAGRSDPSKEGRLSDEMSVDVRRLGGTMSNAEVVGPDQTSKLMLSRSKWG
jgi:hypothetical protein